MKAVNKGDVQLKVTIVPGESTGSGEQWALIALTLTLTLTLPLTLTLTLTPTPPLPSNPNPNLRRRPWRARSSARTR